jgi:hypothetical protein
MRRRCGGRGENHVRFQRVAVVSRSRGGTGAAANDPKPTWGDHHSISLLTRQSSDKGRPIPQRVSIETRHPLIVFRDRCQFLKTDYVFNSVKPLSPASLMHNS